MSKIFDRVKVNCSTTGTGTVTAGSVPSAAFNTLADAGAVNGDESFWMLTEGNDYQIFLGTVGGSVTTVSRDTTLESRIGGTIGTSNMTLLGGATLSAVAPAEAFRNLRNHRTVTGSSDAIANSDGGGIVVYNSASSVAVSLPQAGVSRQFLKRWFTYVENRNTGDVTITPTTSTIRGNTTFILRNNQSAMIYSDGTNYRAMIFRNDVQAQGDFAGMSNGTLSVTGSAGALTAAVKTFAGADPSPADPVFFYFRDSTLGSGLFTRIAATAAISVVLGSTKTCGAGSFPRVYFTAHNDAGTPRVGAFIASDANGGIWCPQENLKYTTTVPDNNAKVFHTTVAIGTAAPWRFIGECEWTSSQTPGTWTTPDIVSLWSSGFKKPGDIVQSAPNKIIGPFSVNTTGTPTDLGNGFSVSITPHSAANIVQVRTKLSCFSNVSAYTIQLFRGSTNIGGGTAASNRVSSIMSAIRLNDTISSISQFDETYDRPNSAASVTYKLQYILQTGTLYVNRTEQDNDANFTARTSSAMDLYEYKG